MIMAVFGLEPVSLLCSSCRQTVCPLQGHNQEFATRGKRGGLGNGSPSGVKGQSPGGVWGEAPEAEDMLIFSYDGGNAPLSPIGYATVCLCLWKNLPYTALWKYVCRHVCRPTLI